MINPARILCLFAHPDDEVLGAGATIAKYAKSALIHFAFTNTSGTSRENDEGREQALRGCVMASSRALGVDNLTFAFGGFPDNRADAGPRLDIVQWVEWVVGGTEPDLVLTHYRRCTNIDHQRCHEAAMLATEPFRLGYRTWVLGCEIPSSSGGLRPKAWEPTLYVPVSRENVRAKVAAMKCYTTEARRYPHPRSAKALVARAMSCGSDAFAEYAEAFMVYRASLEA